MNAIIGLGNPGSKFRGTRHNAGFRAVEEISKTNGISMNQTRHNSLFGSGRLGGGQRILLVKPLVFMNRSGAAVKSIMRYYRFKPQDFLIIYDEAALPLGRIRIRPGGSSGGHNGIESVIKAVSSSDIPRLRLGIGQTEKPSSEKVLADFVLGRFTKSELPLFEKMIGKADTIVSYIIENSVKEAMNKFN